METKPAFLLCNQKHFSKTTPWKSAWFWKQRKQILPINTFCRNCRVRTVGKYCHACGQNIFADRAQSVHTLISRFASNVFSFNGKTLRTLGSLMWRPGYLPKEYRDGKIVNYVHPVKLFWITALVFFALMVTFLNFDGSVSVTREQEANVEPFTIEQELVEQQTNNTYQGTVITVAGQPVEPAQVARYLSRFGPFAAFALTPIFALLLALLFWKNRLFYMYHLVFALHFHAFLWVSWSLLILLSVISPNLGVLGNWLVFAILFPIPVIYLSIAMRRFYQTTRRKAIWKALVLAVLNFSVLLAVMALVAYIIWFLKNGINAVPLS